jgi:uncharacterized SAM-binding protein YcdF (DUF218 family)
MRLRQTSRALRSLRRLLVTTSIVWLLGACAIALAGVTTRPKAADLILVLGNTVDPVNRPLPRLEARLEAALALYRRSGASMIMVSGGIDPDDGRNEALGMRDWLLARGVPPNCVIADARGNNTRASAANAQAWLSAHGLRSAVVVSQYFHLPRARLALRQAGIDDSGGDFPRRWFARDVYSVLREVPGYLAYLMGWR